MSALPPEAAPQDSTISMAAIEGIPATRKRLFESQVLSVCISRKRKSEFRITSDFDVRFPEKQTFRFSVIDLDRSKPKNLNQENA